MSVKEYILVPRGEYESLVAEKNKHADEPEVLQESAQSQVKQEFQSEVNDKTGLDDIEDMSFSTHGLDQNESPETISIIEKQQKRSYPEISEKSLSEKEKRPVKNKKKIKTEQRTIENWVSF